MDPLLAHELARRGLSADGHVSRALNTAAVSQGTLILTFEVRHHLAMLEAWPHAEGRVFGLRQFARGLPENPTRGEMAPGDPIASLAARVAANTLTWDVNDPYGRGRRAARACATEIDDLLNRILPALAGF